MPSRKLLPHLGMNYIIMVSVAICFGIFRFILPVPKPPSWSGTYEAFAHLFVGGLLGAWLLTYKRFFLWLVLLLTALELFAFIYGGITSAATSSCCQ